MRWRSRIFLLLSLSGACASACSGDEKPQETAPEQPPFLRIDSLQPAGGAKWQRTVSPDCVELGQDADQTIVVELHTDSDGELGKDIDGGTRHFTLRGLGGCERVSPCGYVLLTVQGPSGEPYRVGAAATRIPVPFSTFAPDSGSSSLFPEGEYTFHVALRDDQGDKILDASKPFVDEDEVKVTVRQHCGGDGGGIDGGGGVDAMPPPSEGGLDAAPDAVSSKDAATDSPAPDASADAARDAARDATDAASDARVSDVVVPSDAPAGG